MKILITNHDLRFRGGSELFTVGLANTLAATGHTVWVYAPQVGVVAEGLKGATAFSSLDQIPEVPDVIHGQHNLPTAAALCRFTQTPALYHCHGYEPLIERPFAHPRIYRYMGISSRFPAWIAKITGCPVEAVETVYSGIHTENFARQCPVSDRLESALIYGHPRNFEKAAIEEIQSACTSSGIRLQVPDAKVNEPEALLRQFDLIFATGRSAIEAMCAGCCVIPFRRDVCGAMVVPDNYEAQKVINFTVPPESKPVTEQWLLEELRKHDSRVVKNVSQLAAADFSIVNIAERLVRIYESVIAQHSTASINVGTESGALSHWLHTVGREWTEAKPSLQEQDTLVALRELQQKLNDTNQQLKHASKLNKISENFAAKSWLHRLLTRSLRRGWRKAGTLALALLLNCVV